MAEQIGNVVIEQENWNGKDAYSDGGIEQELLDYVKEGKDPMDLLKSDDRYPVLYHFSPERGNAVRWFPFAKDAKVLEVGAGMGAVTGTLCELCGHVTALDLSLTRSKINAYRNQERKNLDIVVSNVQDYAPKQKFDVVTLVGVLEYAGLFFDSENPFEDMLKLLRSHLDKNGMLLIAIENQFGLKYLTGAREDHNWRLYSGVEGYLDTAGGPRTFGRDTLEQMVRGAGFDTVECFYPFPDYKMPRSIFSDYGSEYFNLISPYFPNLGEYAYRGPEQAAVMKAGKDDSLMKTLANSFIMTASSSRAYHHKVLYSRFGTARKDKFAITTTIVDTGKGKHVTKKAANPAAMRHLQDYVRIHKEIGKKYLKFKLPRINATEGGIGIEYIEGISLEAKLLELAKAGNIKGFLKLVSEYQELLQPFLTDHDGKFYGMLNPVLQDFTFDNLILRDGIYTAIDQEWASFKPAPEYYVLWRAIHFFFEAHQHEILFSEEEVLEKLIFTTEMIEECYQMEAAFYQHAFGEDSMMEVARRYEVYAPEARQLDASQPGTALVFHVLGQEKKISQTVDLSGEVCLDYCVSASAEMKDIHFVPVLKNWCDVTVERITLVGEQRVEMDASALHSNAARQKDNKYYFETFNPVFHLGDAPKDCRKIEIIYRAETLGSDYIDGKVLEYQQTARTYEAMVETTSWKVTKPLRMIRKKQKG